MALLAMGMPLSGAVEATGGVSTGSTGGWVGSVPALSEAAGGVTAGRVSDGAGEGDGAADGLSDGAGEGDGAADGLSAGMGEELGEGETAGVVSTGGVVTAPAGSGVPSWDRPYWAASAGLTAMI